MKFYLRWLKFDLDAFVLFRNDLGKEFNKNNPTLLQFADGF